MYDCQDKTLLASTIVAGDGAAHTASGDAAWINVAEYLEGNVFANVTAIDGGTLTLSIDIGTVRQKNRHLPPDSTSLIATSVFTFSGITGTGVALKSITNFGQWIRLRWSLTNSQNATFSAIFQGKGHFK